MQKVIFPLGCTVCSFERIRPVSGVSVVNTSQLLPEKHAAVKLLFKNLSVKPFVCYRMRNPPLPPAAPPGLQCSALWCQCTQDVEPGFLNISIQQSIPYSSVPHCPAPNLQPHFNQLWPAPYLAKVMSPTLFSGLLRVLEWHTMLTASC